jgi:hypothetical protein
MLGGEHNPIAGLGQCEFGRDSQDAFIGLQTRWQSHAREVAQGLGWKMLIGKIVIEDAHLKKGGMGIFVP